MSRETGEILVKLLAKAIDGPAALSRAIAVATLDIAEYIVGCIDCGIASDIHDIKDSLLRKTRAEADAATGEGQKRLAEATEAANHAALHKRKDAIARAEQAQLKAAAEKTQAEADATRSDAETRRLQAQTEAQARLIEAKSHFIEAVSRLRQEGGDIFFDREQLQKMLNAGPPPEEKSD
jgi:murein DD-endopeptidase MepM/ murein hydrolase activator NlpD